MTDRIDKALGRLTDSERGKIKTLLRRIVSGDISGMDIKKLKGRMDIFRVRQGKMRIIFRKDESGDMFILAVERRGDTTYNF